MIQAIQAALKIEKLDGWLFFDHHRRDPIAYRLLGLSETINPSRRWYYYIPTEGTPQKLVHKIEAGVLDSLPGERLTYASWNEQVMHLATILSRQVHIAMQYSPLCAIPYISLVDAGTIELVRNTGANPVSSANLVQLFEAQLSEEQLQSHLDAGRLVDQVRREAFAYVGNKQRAGDRVYELEAQQFIRSRFKDLALVTDHGPIVAVNEHASDPHFEPTEDKNAEIKRGDLLLIDMWAKLDRQRSIYYDITWTGFCGDSVPERIQNVFNIVREARKAAVSTVKSHLGQQSELAGWQVDDAARSVIAKAGYGDHFFHRTGHSIGTEVHGNGANMDNLESHDERQVISNTCFSIEPGIYLPEFGIRSEIDILVLRTGAIVTGEEQEEMVKI